jgi:hypothetical protein
MTSVSSTLVSPWATGGMLSSILCADARSPARSKSTAPDQSAFSSTSSISPSFCSSAVRATSASRYGWHRWCWSTQPGTSSRIPRGHCRSGLRSAPCTSPRHSDGVSRSPLGHCQQPVADQSTGPPQPMAATPHKSHGPGDPISREPGRRSPSPRW